MHTAVIFIHTIIEIFANPSAFQSAAAHSCTL